MKQPKIHIIDTHGTDWGLKNVTSLHWNVEDKILSIQVDFMGNNYDLIFNIKK